MAERPTGISPETTELLEKASHIQRLPEFDLAVEITPKVSDGDRQLYSVLIKDTSKKVDITETVPCAVTKVLLKDGKVVAASASLYMGYLGLTDRQKAVTLANIFYYAEEKNPTFTLHFVQTADREEDQIKAFQKDIRNEPSKLFLELQRALES